MVQKKHTFRVFGFLATIMILASLASLVGTYAYGEFVLKGRLEAAKQELVTKSAYDLSEDIAELEAFDAKVDMAYQLLNNHLAPSKMLEALERITKSTVQLTSFTYTYDPGFQAFLEVSGGTSELASVALQHIEFIKNTLFTEFVMGGVSTNVAGLGTASANEYPVSFSLEGALDKRALAYTGVEAVQISETLPVATEPAPGDETAPAEVEATAPEVPATAVTQ